LVLIAKTDVELISLLIFKPSIKSPYLHRLRRAAFLALIVTTMMGLVSQVAAQTIPVTICEGNSLNLVTVLSPEYGNGCGNNPTFDIITSNAAGIVVSNGATPNQLPVSSGSIEVEVNNNGVLCETYTINITYSDFTPDFTYVQSNTPLCYTMSFSDQSTSSANITAYQWDFGFTGGS
jgi:hypothetical protein